MLRTEEVLALFHLQDELEDALLAGLDAKSVDRDLPKGDFMSRYGTQTLVQPELLSSSGILPDSQVHDSLEPAQHRGSHALGNA